ncbi:hypothetical protein BGZ60DRAFT_538845 [Tricladium varicosporioides]|nr:hypothetical protein BGZ60DRAFT_538845 [Hymenoscyphus varicosporioides]
MSSLNHEPSRGRAPERDRRYFNHRAHNDEHHYHHRPHSRPPVSLDPLAGTMALRHQQSNERARSQSIRRLGPELAHTRYSRSVSPARVSSYLGVPIPRKRSNSEKTAEKVISTAAAAAFRMRNDPGHWVGKKGFRVAGAAVAAATVDALLDTNPNKHPLKHIAASMVQGVVMDMITDSGLH